VHLFVTGGATARDFQRRSEEENTKLETSFLGK